MYFFKANIVFLQQSFQIFFNTLLSVESTGIIIRRGASRLLARFETLNLSFYMWVEIKLHGKRL